MKDAQPATALFIEFYSLLGEDFVRVMYKLDPFDVNDYVLYDALKISDF